MRMTTTASTRILNSSTCNDGSRLQLIVRPKHYDIVYHRIDLVNDYTFEGTVSLQGVALQGTTLTSIVVHALDIQLIRADFRQEAAASSVVDCEASTDRTNVHPEKTNNKTLTATGFRYSRKHQTCEIDFTEYDFPLVENEEYSLRMEFCGVLNDQMRGLYRSTYTGLDGITKHTMATTQFEPTEARRAFPCLDEPALKATFQLTVTVPFELQCISNTPIESCHTRLRNVGNSSGVCTTASSTKLMKTVTFQTTPKMSTYLVALIVGIFDCVSKTSSSKNNANNQVVTTVYTVPGKADSATFCLDVAYRCLDLYQELFQIPHVLPKSDLIAIPDFASGAMENWGCVTYREAKVLVNPNFTSENIKRGIARTVCHELAHQWFGNLVTMEWWTQLYLKEGMARYMEFIATDILFPEWDVWTEFVQSVYGMAMSLDSMESSHPVEVEVHHPDEIESIFDAISYAKGASILRMIASYIGNDVFFEGMRSYLKLHSYGNTVTNDLWKALEVASGKPVVDFMAPWTTRMGYPILHLADDGMITVERFLANGFEINNNNSSTEPSTVWPIPVTAKVDGCDETLGPWILYGTDPNIDQTNELQTKIQEWTASSKWFKLNINQTGFFRVNYSETQWHRLASVLQPGGNSCRLSTSDRLGLISDSFASGKAGYSSITNALILIERFGEHEIADYAVWEELSDNIAAFVSLYRSESFYKEIQSLIKRLYSRQLHLLGWEAKPNESGRTGTLRSTVIGMMGKTGDVDVAEKAYDIFQSHITNPEGSPLPGDLRSTIFRCALRHDERLVYQKLQSMFEQTTFPEVQRDCLSVMGCVVDAKRHADMLEYVFNSGKVRLQDMSFALATLASATDDGGRATWEYFKHNFDTIKSKLISGPMWPVCVGLCCSGMTSTLQATDEVKIFFENPIHSPGSALKRLTQALEVIRTKACRRERDRDTLREYFQSSLLK